MLRSLVENKKYKGCDIYVDTRTPHRRDIISFSAPSFPVMGPEYVLPSTSGFYDNVPPRFDGNADYASYR